MQSSVKTNQSEHVGRSQIDLPAEDRLCSRYPTYSRIIWWAMIGLTLALLIAFCPVAIIRAVNDQGGTDFPEFYDAGKHLSEHGVTKPGSMAAYYLPSIDALWVIVASMPLAMASCVWYIIGSVGWIGSLLAIHKYILVDMDESLRREALAVAALVTLPLALDGLCLGAFHTLMLWWWIAGLGRVSQGRDISGGILLGLAVWIKLLPALGIAYLMLKGKWKAVIVAGLSVIVVNGVLCMSAFGPRGTRDAHVAWMNRDAAGTIALLLNEEGGVAEQRVTNQSMLAVLRRVLTQFGVSSDLDLNWMDAARNQAAIGHVNSAHLRLVYVAFSGTLLLLLIGPFLRDSGRTLSATRWPTEIALVVASSLWFSPIAPSYHPIVMAPVLAILFARGSFRPLGILALALWILAMSGHAWPMARAFGHVLWLTMILGGMLVWSSTREMQVPAPIPVWRKRIVGRVEKWRGGLGATSQ